MAYTHVDKSSGQLIRSADWNEMGHELVRLEGAKVNRSGDTISGELKVSGPGTFESALAVKGGLEVGGDLKVNGTRLKNAAGFGVLQTNANDWLRINPDSQYPGIALYKSTAIGEGGLAVGEWSQLGKGELKVTGAATFGGSVNISGLTTLGNDLQVNGARLKNAAGFGILQTNANDWLRINPDSQYPGIALYKSTAIGEGGLAVGEWSQLGKGELKVTGAATFGGSVNISGSTTLGNVQLGGFSGEEKDEWPFVSWYRNPGAGWDEGLIKHGKERGKFGRAGYGIHMHQSRDFGFFSTGWDSLFAVEGGSGNTFIKGKLEIGGDAQITGNVSFGASVRQMINLWNAAYGIGVQNATQYFRSDKNFAWYKGGSHNDTELHPGGGGVQMVLKDGCLGLGTATPRTELDTGKGILSGAANDYMKAQFTLSGGGTVTWGGPGGRLKWTARFIAISMERSVSAAHGHINIIQPTSDIPAAQVYDGAARSATAEGVVLNGWEALYAVHTVGGDESAVSYRIVRYTNDFYAPSNWILVAVANHDDHTLKLGSGVILSRNSASTQGSPIPRGVIMMWSGAKDNLPWGWALCDGSQGTPNLQDKFIVGAGSGYGVGFTGGANEVRLTTAQMPSHNHSNGPYKYLSQITGTWTSSSTDNSATEPNLVQVGEIVAAGGDQAHENRPPFYALCYIMKL